MPNAFCGRPKYNQVCERLRTVLMTAKRNSVPVFVASNRLDAWETDKVRHLVQTCGLHVSRHHWCTLNIKAMLSPHKSAVVHRIASLPALQNTPCRCSQDVPHVNDVALQKEVTSHRRGEAEQQFVRCMLQTALTQATAEPELESKNPADSLSIPVVETANSGESEEFNFPVHDAGTPCPRLTPGSHALTASSQCFPPIATCVSNQ